MRTSTSILFFLSLLLSGCNSEPRKAETNLVKETTVADIESGIRAHIKSATARFDGSFPLPYEEDTLYLNLVRVHTEYLSNLGPERHFACVDLADENGDVFDVDFFLSGKPGAMEVTETTVHKRNGKPFYTWKQLEDKTWERVKVDKADQKLMGVIENKDSFRFYYDVFVPEIEGEGTLWLPVPQTNAFQEIELLESPAGGEIKIEEKNGNRYWVGKVNRARKMRFIYDVTRKEKAPYEDADIIPSDYLGASPLMPVGGRFEGLVKEILKDHADDSKLMQARAIYDYIIDTVRYRKAGKYGTGDANYACDTRSGNCTEFHSLFISLARSARIPARFAIGAAIPSARNEGGVNGYHCWAEFYAEGKWWPVDISEANKYSALATYYFGHHPANRIEFSRGRDLIMNPSPSTDAVPFFAYPILEVNGIPVAIETKFSFERRKSVSSS